MDNTQLILLSEQLAAIRSMDAIANNLANMSTTGFKRETPQFQEFVEQVQPAEGQTGTQSLSFVQNTGMLRDLSGGHIVTTNAPFDCAINGQGYFVIQTANGALYTRNGHFSLDASGQIVTDNGDPVQGDGGNISISPDDGDIHIAADGTVSGVKGQIGKISLVDFANDAALVKQGDSLYSTTQPSQPATTASIKQGTIESSNVEPVVEMSNMIEAMRSYQATANLSQSQSALTQQAIDKLATIQS